MRIARIVARLPPAAGGKEIHASELSRALAQQGAGQALFFREGRIPPGCRGTRMARSSAQPLAFGAWSIRSALAAHRRQPFDLIHAHGDFAEALAAAALSRRTGIPAVLTVHGGLSHDRAHDLVRLGAFSAMATILAVSEGVAEDLARIGVSAPVVVRPSGVREEFFEVQPVAHARPTAVALGRLAPVKGYETIAAAARALPQVRWRVVGGGDDAYAVTTRALLADAGVEVEEAVGPVSAADALAAADVLVLPSRSLPGQREGTPTAALEALAVGLPVAASDAAGLNGWLSRGAAIHEFPADDGMGLARAVSDALAAPRPDRRRTSRLVQTWDEVAADIAALYGRLLDTARRPAALYATAWLELGGAENLMLTLAEDAVRRGYRVAVAGAPGSLVARRPEGSEYVPLRRGNRPATLLRNSVALAGVLVRLRPRAVNVHHFPVGMSMRLGQVVARDRARAVLTVHVPERPVSEAIIGVLGPLLFDRVLAVADSVRDDLARAALPLRRGRLEVVRAGVGAPAAVPVRPRTIGVVARLVERKGHRHLLEALTRIPEAELRGWQVEIWGDGPLREELEALSRQLGLDRLVRFGGPVPDAAARLGEFEAVVLPSTREGLPLLLLEAMAAGRPIVATALPGVEELVGDSGAAILVAPADPYDLSRALREVIGSESLRARLGALGRALYEQSFTLEMMQDAYARALGLQEVSSDPRRG